MTQPITPYEAQERARKASPGRKHIVLGQNYERLHAALAIRPKGEASTPPRLLSTPRIAPPRMQSSGVLMSNLSPTEQTRVLDAYQAARERMDHGAAAIHVITTTQLPQGAVRAVIAAYRHDIGEIET